MIKNIILDVGMVLVDFIWEKVFEDLGICGEAKEIVGAATTLSPDWNELDRGVLSDEEVLKRFVSNAPEYEAEIYRMWEHKGAMVVAFPYAETFVKDLKAKGYGVYILSNYPRSLYEATKEALKATTYADGRLFSHMVGLTKPEKEIYEYLLNEYDLNPDECLFLDDNAANIKAAEELGIHGIHFTSFEKAKSEMRKYSIEI